MLHNIVLYARKNWFWYPFDDSRVLCDPYTTYRGLGDPRGCFKVIPGPYFRVYSVHIVIQSNLVCFGLLKTDFDTHLTIQEASKTLISNTTNRGLGKPREITSFKVSPGQYFRIYSVTKLLYNQILYVWGMYKLIIWHPFDNARAFMTLILPRGVTRDPGILFQNASCSIFQDM